MKKIIIKYIPFLLIAFVVSCNLSEQEGADRNGNGEEFPDIKVQRDLDEILESGELVAITAYSTTSYFIYRGAPRGYEYELLQRLADYLNVELKIEIARDMDELFEMLNEGKGDIIAHNMAITRSRSEKVDFTDQINTTKQVLVQRKPDNWRSMRRHQIDNQLLRNQIELVEKPVHVRRHSSYFGRLINLEEEIGGQIDIRTVPGHYSTEQLIGMVADGEIEYTVADENIAKINKAYYDNIDIETAVSFPQRVAWAVRKNAPDLRDTVNTWLSKMKDRAEFYVIYNKYFESQQAHRQRVQSEFFSITGSRLTPYDEILQSKSKEYGFDWRLLASLMYQESRFDPHAVSWAGAQGVMQLMPATGRQFGVNNPFDPRQNIRAGVRYLHYLDKFWKERFDMKDDEERIKFILASYNAGPGHVADARRLAEKFDHDPDIWYGNVDEFIRKKAQRKYYMDEVVRYGYCRGEEPYQYVRKIMNRYKHYKNFILPEEEEGEVEDQAIKLEVSM